MPAGSGHDPSGPAAPAVPAGSGDALPVAWRYGGTPPQEAKAAKEVVYGAPAEVQALPVDEAEVVGYMPIRRSDKFGYFIDERGGLGDLDVRVKKARGCQGSGSAARHSLGSQEFLFRFSKLYIKLM